MSILLSTGAQTLATSEQGGRKEKVEFLKLKSGESSRVVFIPDGAAFASAEYLNHSDFENRVYSHPCLSPTGSCHSCDKSVPRTRRFLIAFHNLDTGVNVALDISRRQYNQIKTAVSDYLDDESLFEMAFKLSKTGSGTDSGYSIAPIMNKKLQGDEPAKVAAVRETVLDEDFFENALRPRTNEQLREMLAGYGGSGGASVEDEVTPIAESNDPTSGF